jgi:hypothetical protein
MAMPAGVVKKTKMVDKNSGLWSDRSLSPLPSYYDMDGNLHQFYVTGAGRGTMQELITPYGVAKSNAEGCPKEESQ